MSKNEEKVSASDGELYVKIQTPESIIWEGSAEAVSSQNSLGPFDILPEHANIITMIERYPITIVLGKKMEKFTFERAILSVQNNRVSIYADINLKEEKLDSANSSNKS